MLILFLMYFICLNDGVFRSSGILEHVFCVSDSALNDSILFDFVFIHRWKLQKR